MVVYFLRLSVTSCPFRYSLPNRNLVSPIRNILEVRHNYYLILLDVDENQYTFGGAGGNRTLVLNIFLFTSVLITQGLQQFFKNNLSMYCSS